MFSKISNKISNKVSNAWKSWREAAQRHSVNLFAFISAKTSKAWQPLRDSETVQNIDWSIFTFPKISKAWRIWHEASKLHKANPSIKRRDDELEFLPAAVELLESPASPAGHFFVFLIIGLVVFVVLWATFGRVDMVATAQGRIVPGGNVKIVQSFEPGVVQEILVRDGEQVEQGQLLIKLDPLEAEVDTAKLEKEYEITSLEVTRLEAFLDFLDDPEQEFSATDIELPITHRQRLQSEIQSYTDEHERIDGEKAQLQAQMQGVKAEIDKIKALLPMTAEHELALQGLLENEVVAKTQWVAEKQKLIELQQNLKISLRRLDEIELAVSNKGKEKQALQTNTIRNTRAQLTDFRNQSELSLLNLRKAQNRETRSNITSPVSGSVQQLAVHTIGGVVKAAESLMIVVPHKTQLIVEASVLNKDIGFVEVGQEVEIKLESFPFTKYGLMNGVVLHISADAVADERLGLVYAMRASLEENQILVNGRMVPLSPGMAATAEVKIGERSIMDFFLSPISKSGQEAFKER